MSNSGLEILFFAGLTPDDGEGWNPATSTAGELFQRNMLGHFVPSGLPMPEVWSYVPTPSFPKSKRLFFRGKIGHAGSIPLRTLGFVNFGPLKILSLGLTASVRVVRWGWRHRRSPRRVAIAYNLNAPPALPIGWVCRLMGIRFVPFVGDLYVPGEVVPNSLMRRLEFRAQIQSLKLASDLIVANRAIVEDYAAGREALILEGGFVESQFAGLGDPPEWRGGPFVVVFAGQLSELNGVELLLDAIRVLDGPNFRFVILGGGALHDKVAAAAKADSRIDFRGRVTHAEVLDAYRGAHLLLNLRRTDNQTHRYVFPSKVVECLATGRPLLTTLTGHVESEFGGFVFPLRAECPNALAGEIARIASLPDEERCALGRLARRYAMDGKSWTAQGRRLHDLLLREDQKRKILVFADYYVPGFKGGGPVRSVSRLIHILKDEFEFAVFTRDRDLGEDDPYPGIEAGRWSDQLGVRHFYATPKQLNAKTVLSAIRDVRPDVIYLNSYFSKLSRIVLGLRLAGKLRGIAILAAPRGEFSEGALALKAFKKRAYLGLARTAGLHRRLTWQVSSAKELADTRAVISGDPRCFIKAPDILVPTGRIPRVERGKKKGECRFVFLGRVSPMKNLVGAIEMLKGLEGDVWFDIYGPSEDETYATECTRAIDELGPNVRVDFRGPVRPEQVFDIFESAHFMLLPTLGENFGHVIPEALAAGCPVLISDRTPWCDLEEQGCGWAMPLEDRALWHKTLQDAVDLDAEGHEAMARSAFEYVERLARSSSDRETNRAMFEAALANQGRRAA